MPTESTEVVDTHVAFGDLDSLIAALSSAVQEEMDKSKVQNKVLPVYSWWYPFPSQW